MKILIQILFLVASLKFSFGQSVEWVKAFNGNSIDRVVDMAIDSDDNIILLGFYSQSIDLDPGPDTLNPPTNAINNIFIEKLTSDGNLIWLKTIGESGYENPGKVEVDHNGNIFLSGDFRDSVDINPGADTLNLYNTLGKFILKLDSAGNFNSVYSLFGSISSFTRAFTIKKNGNVLFGEGPYIYELDTSLQIVSTQFIALYTGISHIIIDDESNIIIGGSIQYPTDFDPGPDTFLLSPPNNYNRFFAKYDSLGNFIWAKTIGNNTPGTNISDVASDHSGNIYYSLFAFGSLCMSDNFDDTCLTSVNAVQSSFFLKFSPIGEFEWSQILDNPSGFIYSYDIEIDQNNRQYFTGVLDCNVDFDPGPDTFMVTTNSHPAYLQILDSNNTFLNFSSYTGGSLKAIRTIKVNSQGTLYAAGYFQGTSVFDSIAGISSASQGDDDGFLVKYNQLILGNYSEKIKNNTLSIYPNPGTDQINIKLENSIGGISRIRIINTLGITVWNSKEENSHLNEGYQISLSDLSNGIYTIVVSTENKTFSGRYIRQN